jgi:hypothetical protein
VPPIGPHIYTLTSTFSHGREGRFARGEWYFGTKYVGSGTWRELASSEKREVMLPSFHGRHGALAWRGGPPLWRGTRHVASSDSIVLPFHLKSCSPCHMLAHTGTGAITRVSGWESRGHRSLEVASVAAI